MLLPEKFRCDHVHVHCIESVYMYTYTVGAIVIRRVQGHTVFINPRALSCSVLAVLGYY